MLSPRSLSELRKRSAKDYLSIRNGISCERSPEGSLEKAVLKFLDSVPDYYLQAHPRPKLESSGMSIRGVYGPWPLVDSSSTRLQALVVDASSNRLYRPGGYEHSSFSQFMTDLSCHLVGICCSTTPPSWWQQSCVLIVLMN